MIQSEATERNKKKKEFQELTNRLVRSREETSQKRKRKRILKIAVTLIIIAGGVFLWFMLKSIPVEVSYVSYQRVGTAAQPILRLSGYITYPQISTIGSTMSAPVQEVPISEGDSVKSGAVLARFDQTELLAQKKIQEIGLQNIQQTLNRTERLHTAGAASDADLQNVQSQFEKARADLDLLKAKLKATTVYAPFDGLIIEKLVNIGEIPAHGICRIADNSMTLVAVDVGQEDINKISSIQPAVVTLDAYPDIEYAAQIYKIMPTANQAKNTIPVLIHILKPDSYFRPQMSAKVFFVNKQIKDNQKVRSVLSVEKSAIFQSGGQSYVWRIRRGRVYKQQIKTGEQYGDNIQILDGLEADERIVANEAKYKLKNRSRVSLAQ